MPITKFTNNTAGIDISSSPLSISDNSATGQSYNYSYPQAGGFSKDLAPRTINASADTQTQGHGVGVHHDVSTNARTLVRVAGTKIQTVGLSTGLTTNQTDDTVSATSDFPSASSTQPVVFAPFNTLTGGTQLWMAGGGMASVMAYTGSKLTANGVAAPTGSIGRTVNTTAGGSFTTIGTYFYAVQFRKLSTQAFSNLALDASATIVNTTDTVTINLATITNVDTTLYDQVWIWRSAVGGVTSFTTGSIIAKLASTATSYTDTGSSIADSQNAARAGNTVIDNSVLGTATYNYVTGFKRRLIAASNSTIYLSDLNKPESWPTANYITIPTGGPITGLAILGVPSEYTTGADEYLVIFKEREMWVLTGTTSSDWELKQVDKSGCQGQSLAVSFNGYLTWIGVNGVYIWDGRGRPSRVSRPISALFGDDGDLDVANLSLGCGCFYEKANQVVWRLSHRQKGINKFTLKLDVRLTARMAAQNLQAPEMEGVFIFGYDSNAIYGLTSYRPTNLNEQIIAHDASGNIYEYFNSGTVATSFDYETKPLDMGLPENNKRFNRVLVWVERLTPNDLTLFYWADYRNRDEYRSKIPVSLAPLKGTQPALWDIALWDQAMWDDYTPDISPIEYDLYAYDNNAEGLALKLRFEQLEASAPVRIHGFAVDWEDLGPISIPTAQLG